MSWSDISMTVKLFKSMFFKQFSLKHTVSVLFLGKCINLSSYNYPPYEAGHAALKTVREWLVENDNYNKVNRVIFCTYTPENFNIYQELMARLYFPVAPPVLSNNIPQSKKKNKRKPTLKFPKSNTSRKPYILLYRKTTKLNQNLCTQKKRKG